MGREYTRDRLDEGSLKATWLLQFRRWFEDAEASPALSEPNAMVLATCDREGQPSARTVLLKHVDDAGFVFFTNRASRKGKELATNPIAALVFAWLALERQVTVLGRTEPVDSAFADAYFASRGYGSQVGAHASRQSQILPSRAALEQRRAAMEARFPRGSAIPRPEKWSGFCVAPREVEFWQGRPNRLHDRLRYRLDEAGAWTIERLSP
jgi:pyridoxamine 5'-phosphate oxidase